MTSESTDKLIPALLAAQGEIQGVVFDSTNPHYKSKFASLLACWNAVKPALQSAKLVLTQVPAIETCGMVLRTRIIHTSGQWIECAYPIRPTKDDPQMIGSAVTYARRYSLCAMLSLVGDEDDDGNSASAPQPQAQRPVATKPTEESPRARLANLVLEWSGVESTDLKSAMLSICEAADIVVKGKLTEQQVVEVTEWCAFQINKGIDFADAVGKEI